MSRHTYKVIATRWEHGWELEIEGVGTTQSHSLVDAEEMVRSYLLMDFGDQTAKRAQLDIVPRLEDGLAEEVAAVKRETAELANKQRVTAARSREVVRKLKDAGLSGADTAVVLDISPQRVSQLRRGA